MANSDDQISKAGCLGWILFAAGMLVLFIVSINIHMNEQEMLGKESRTIKVIDKDIVEVSSGPLAGDEEGHFIRAIIYDKDNKEIAKKWIRVSEGKYGRFYIDSTYPSNLVDVTRTYHDDNFR